MTTRTLVLGPDNPSLADDGVGIHVARADSIQEAVRMVLDAMASS